MRFKYVAVTFYLAKLAMPPTGFRGYLPHFGAQGFSNPADAGAPLSGWNSQVYRRHKLLNFDIFGCNKEEPVM